MNEAIVIEQAEVVTALGGMRETVAALEQGRDAVKSGPCFGVPCGYAPFADLEFRNPDTCAMRLASHLHLRAFDSSKTLFVYCAAKGDVRSLDALEDNPQRARALGSPFLGMQAHRVRSCLGIPGSVPTVVSTACASGSVAVEVAAEFLKDRQFDHAVIFAYDSLSRFVATGFQCLGALSPTKARPFDRGRDGLTLGEGAAIAVLTRRKPAKGQVYIAGAGSSNDANHRTGPSRTGEGLYMAARAALTDAELQAAEVGAVKCHGTATLYNDAMEAKALASLFGNSPPPCVSVKGAIGHTSGASSLIEILLASAFLKNRRLPPTAGFLSLGVEEHVPVSASIQPIERPAVLCLSAGFGGINGAVVLRGEPS